MIFSKVIYGIGGHNIRTYSVAACVACSGISPQYRCMQHCCFEKNDPISLNSLFLVKAVNLPGDIFFRTPDLINFIGTCYRDWIGGIFILKRPQEVPGKSWYDHR